VSNLNKKIPVSPMRSARRLGVNFVLLLGPLRSSGRRALSRSTAPSEAYQAIGDAAKSKAAQTELRRLNTDGTWSGSSALLQELSNVAHSAD